MTEPLTLSRVQPADGPLLDKLWQFYELESSFWSNEDVDASGRFTSLSGFLSRLGDPEAFDWAYLVRQGDELVGFLLVGHQNLFDRSIMEFGDLYVQPKFRRRGIATAVIRQTVLASDHPWLVCVFRDDRQAQAFWDRAFQRLPFASVREVDPPDVPTLRQFVINDARIATARPAP